MLIYVIKRSWNIYEPIVDVINGEIKIPAWEDTRIIEAEEKGAKYRESGAILGYVYYGDYLKLCEKLHEFLKRVEDVKNMVEKLNPYADKRSLEEFMASNAATLQFGGDSLLEVSVDKGYLKLLNNQTEINLARDAIREYEAHKEENDYEYRDEKGRVYSDEEVRYYTSRNAHYEDEEQARFFDYLDF